MHHWSSLGHFLAPNISCLTFCLGSQGPIAARCLSLKSDALRLEGDVAVKAGDW